MKPIVFFDGVCTLCNYSIDFILKHEKADELTFASLQSKMAESILKDNALGSESIDSIVFYENGLVYIESTAVLKICKYLRFPYCVGYGLIIIPKPLRNVLYQLVARKRYIWFGKKDSCRVPTEAEKQKILG